MNNHFDFTLPEWAFLDGSTHKGDILEGRTILQHIQSYSLLEFIQLEDEDSELKIPAHLKFREFDYQTIYGNSEKHLLIVHFTLAGSVELDWILERAIEFYEKFMDWQDASSIIEETAGEN